MENAPNLLRDAGIPQSDIEMRLELAFNTIFEDHKERFYLNAATTQDICWIPATWTREPKA